jgi:hypothetical protein
VNVYRVIGSIDSALIVAVDAGVSIGVASGIVDSSRGDGGGNSTKELAARIPGWQWLSAKTFR